MALVLLLIVACAGEPPPPAPATVLLVSLDTTRADALGCYQAENQWALAFPADSRPTPRTPVVDRLASEGVRFAWALAHAPTTLNSHATIFSGRDPHRHAVPRNGYPVPTDYPLLAERFRDAGWDTVAVVGSSAMERKMGLDRGFRVYQDPGEQPAGGMLLLGADEVTRRALAQVDARPEDGKTRPLFLFAHYYDAHTPWFTAPPEVTVQFTRSDYDGPVDGSMASVGFLTQARRAGELRYKDARQARALYLAQVAWADQQVGVLLAGLQQRGLLDNALVVVLADHGETLDESATNPYTHGPNAGLVDLHVPLVLWGSGTLDVPAGVVVSRRVRLMDVASTIAAATGLGSVMGDGEDLGPLMRGQVTPAPPSFAEATKPMSQESKTHWNNLPFERGVFKGAFYLRVRPLEKGLATLHRIAPDEAQVDDLERLKSAAALLKAWDANAPAYRPAEYDAATEAALRSLGYLE